MLRKIIFALLALLLASLLAILLRETWTSGQIHVITSSRGIRPFTADYSYSGEHAQFLLQFGVEVFGAICAVLMLFGLGWARTGKEPDRNR